MSKSSVIMLSSTQGQLELTGDPLRADGWYGYTDGLHTVAIYLANFTGRVIIEASIDAEPAIDDWFPIEIKGNTYLEFSQTTSTIGFNLVGNFTWLRARIDREYLELTDEQKANQIFVGTLGYVDRILLNN